MAELSMTVSNSINLFGGQLTNKWGAMVWGTDKWGDGLNMLNTITKVYSDQVVVTNVILNKDITKVYSDPIVVSNLVSKETTKLIVDSFVVSNVIYKDIEKVIDSPVTLTDSLIRDIDKIIVNSISIAGDLYSEEKIIENWKYIVAEDSTNFESRWSGAWSRESNSSSAYTSGACSTVSWTTLT